MFASVIEIQFKPGKTDEAVEFARSLVPELAQIDGLKQFVSVDRGNDKGLILVIYESEAQREAAAPKAQEMLGRLADLMAAPPDRQGCEVTVNESF